MKTNMDQPDNRMKTANAKAVARYRAGKQRIDYLPAPDIRDWLNQVMADNPGWSYSGVLDHLLREYRAALPD